MKKLVPMAVAAVCVATVAFASVRQPSSVSVNPHRAIVDTVVPQDTTITPKEDTSTTPAVDVDTSTVSTDTSSAR